MTTALLLRYVREQGGDDAVREVVERSGVPPSVEELEDESVWCSLETRLRLFEATTRVLGDPHAIYHVGASALRHRIHPSLRLVLRALGTPRAVFVQASRAVPTLTTTSTSRLVSSKRTSAIIEYRRDPSRELSPLDCDYVMGLCASVPEIFGLRAGRVVHHACQCEGAEACILETTWHRELRLGLGSRRRADVQISALRDQLSDLQSAASDLTGSDDPATAVQRILDRASAAVVAPAYLLVLNDVDATVQTTTSGGPGLQWRGMTKARAVDLAHRIRRGERLGRWAVVVGVSSSRANYGSLAAIYPNDYQPFDATALLGAYARHVAAALDLLGALSVAQREAERARALLSVAHDLAQADQTDEVARVVASALRGALSSDGVGLWLWDPDTRTLRGAVSLGHGADDAEIATASVLDPERVPELVAVLSDKQPRVVREKSASPDIAWLMRRLGVPVVVASPLLATDQTLVGIATASWRSDAPGWEPSPDLMATMGGVCDLGATALQKAQLAGLVYHQARHDALSGLLNRAALIGAIDDSLASLGPGDSVGLLFCDLDGFKAVNDQFGHATGDAVLRAVAERLTGAVDPRNAVARLGGDEFAILLRDSISSGRACEIAQDVVAAVVDVPVCGGVEIGVSVGVALHSGPGGDASRLLAAADAAMYEAKRGGTSRVVMADEGGTD